MYRPHYLNVERTYNLVVEASGIYLSKGTVKNLGYKKKPPEKTKSKSCRRFAGKVGGPKSRLPRKGRY